MSLRQRFMAEVLLPLRDQVLDRGRIADGEVDDKLLRTLFETQDERYE